MFSFTPVERGVDDPPPALPTGSPLTCVDAPAGGPMWIITDEELGRAALLDERLVKDPAQAPPSWDRWSAGLEPTAAEHPSLTTLDGPAHARLRRAHASLFSTRRIGAEVERITAITRELLHDTARAPGPVDLMADFTVRLPLTVICALLGVPDGRVDDAVRACRQVLQGDPAAFGSAMGTFHALSEAAVAEGGPDSLAARLQERLGDRPPDELSYHLFGLIFASQITTETALGFLIAAWLRDEPADRPRTGAAIEELVTERLRRHPPAPFSLFRFTATDLELGGQRLPAHTPVVVHIAGIHARLAPGVADLTFGAGAHYCIGAQLAQAELRAVLQVLRDDHPTARLAVPYARLRRVDVGVQSSRLTTLPVLLS